MTDTARHPFRTVPTSPGTERSYPRRPDAVREAGAPAPAAGSWPERTICGGETAAAGHLCVLPFPHLDTCLPAPRSMRSL